MKRKQPIGQVPAGRIAIVDYAGNVRGHCGATATQALVSRFGVGRNAELKTVKGRKEWHGLKPKATK
jgi:hypothetical protein